LTALVKSDSHGRGPVTFSPRLDVTGAALGNVMTAADIGPPIKKGRSGCSPATGVAPASIL